MKALTLWQPWASLIAEGLKTIETRSYPVSYRGPLAIHAAKRWTAEEEELGGVWPLGDVLPLSFWNDPPRGCIVAVADLFDCRPVTPDVLRIVRERRAVAYQEDRPSEYHFGDYAVGRYMWMLCNIRKLDTPIPVRGMQGLWDWQELTP